MDIAMDKIKLLEDSDPLISGPELNERLQGKVQNILLCLLKVLIKERLQGTVKCQDNFLAHLH